MNQEQTYNRNNKQYICLACKQEENCYFATRFKSSLSLAIGENCYQKLTKDKDEYINMKAYRNYQLEVLKKTQPLFYFYSEIGSKINDNLALTEEQKSNLKELNQQFYLIDKMLSEVEQGSSESISKLLFVIKDTQEKQYNDLLIILKLDKQMNFLEKIDIHKFRIEQDQYFGHNIQKFLRVLFINQMQNDISKKIKDTISNCIEFPLFLQIVGDKFNDPSQKEYVKYNYYGSLNRENQKEGLGLWNDQKQLFYGIFYQDIFLWGIKVIIYSGTQFSLFKGFFSRCQENDGENYLLNGTGEMISIDEYGAQHEYQGRFTNEKRQGEGIYTWKSMDNKEAKYTGSWLNDQYHGQGTLEISDQNITIKGEFSFGVPIQENCEITGKDLPQQLLSDYIARKNKETQQQPIMKPNFATIQKPQIQSTFPQSQDPFCSKNPVPFQFPLQSPKKFNQTIQTPFQSKQSFNQVNLKKP